MTSFAGADRDYFYGGGMPPKLEREISVDFEPGALVNKAYADVVSQEEQLDANILRGMPFGRERSEPNRPMLDVPVMSLRISSGGGGEGEELQFQKSLQSLLNSLPKELREKLSQELSRPLAEQNPSFAALSRALAYAAGALAMLARAKGSFEGNAAALRHAGQNLVLTEGAMRELLQEGRQFLKEGFQMLKELGPNHPRFDERIKELKEAESALKMLKRLYGEEREKKGDSEEEGEEGREGRERELAKLVEGVELFNRQHREAAKGGELAMAGPLLSAIEALARAEKLQGGLRSLFLALLFHDIGMERAPFSTTAPFGEGILRFVCRMIGLIEANLLSEFDPKAVEFFPRAARAFILFAVTGALHLMMARSSSGEGGEWHFEEEFLTEDEEILINCYALWNLMAMSVEVKAVEALIPNEITGLKWGLTDAAGIARRAIELTAMGIAIRAIKPLDEDAANLLLGGLAKELIERMLAIEELIEAGEGNEKEESLTGDERKRFSVALTKCRIALQEEAFHRWHGAWDELMALSSEEVDGEIEKLYRQAELLQALFSVEIGDFEGGATGIVKIHM